MKKNASEEAQTQDLRNSYIDERTEERIQEHLTNENDIITEEDIANAPTGIVEKKGSPDPAKLTEKQKETLEEEAKMLEEKKLKNNEDPAIETPWNVLGS